MLGKVFKQQALSLGLIAIPVATGSGAFAADLRIVAQSTGTFSFELNELREPSLRLDIRRMASPESGKVALLAGSADLIVADLVFAARARAAGRDVVFVPYSSSLGSLLVASDSPIANLSDLAGKRLGIAGGPLDKSWLLLQAFAGKHQINLKDSVHLSFGAPRLLAEKARQGELDAVLTYWNIGAELEAAGFRSLLNMVDIERDLGARGPTALLGYVFERPRTPDLQRTFAAFFHASSAARARFRTDMRAWSSAAKMTRETDDATLMRVRERYLGRLTDRSVSEEEQDARTLFRVLAEAGGTTLTGGLTDLPAGLFYDPGAGE